MPDRHQDLEEPERIDVLEDPVLAPGQTYGGVTDQINSIVIRHPRRLLWFTSIGLAFVLLMIFNAAVTILLWKGIGMWGVNIPVAWGFAIVNFVWWIGIGHAGTLISAILLLLHQSWRNSINRFAEAMTLFAVMCAGMFPLLHLGRPWLFYYLLPYPNVMAMWPQFRSPLVWDVFAVSTYGTVSLIFWYVGLIPDLASVRDTAKSRTRKVVYGIFALGWRGSAKHWQRYQSAYLLLAGLATPLVISVHTVVSFDFSVAIVPGWHSTIFPPYFVAGAIYSGFAMVIMLAIPIRSVYGLQNLVTVRHLDNMAKVMLATGLIVAYSYVMEMFIAWYSQDTYEQFMIFNRMSGPYASVFWALIGCNLVVPQVLWFRKVRRNVFALWVTAAIVQTGMWLERYVIVITSLHRDFLPKSWGMYAGTPVDWGVYIGTIGVFLFFFFLFLRYVPMIPAFEVRELIHRQHTQKEHV